MSYQIANTPSPPYYAVIFTSVRTDIEHDYAETAERMVELANEEDGFLGVESARNDIGITISYWNSLEAIIRWKNNAEHLIAQQRGIQDWYRYYKTRICRVERDYDFTAGK